MKMDRLTITTIFFSDEAHFQLCGYVNKQNCHIWCSPQVIEEMPLHPEKVIVWCTLYSEGLYQNMVENYLKRINTSNTSRVVYLNDIVSHIMSTFKLYNKK